MEATWFLKWELLRLRCDTTLVLSILVSDNACTQCDRITAYMIVIEKKHEQESNW